MKFLFAFLYFFGYAAAISQGIPPQCNVVSGGVVVKFGCDQFGLKSGMISRLNCTEPSPGIMPWALGPKIKSATALDGMNSDSTGPSPYTLRSGDGAVSSDPTSYRPGELNVLYLRVNDYNFKYRGLLGYARPTSAGGDARRVGDWEQPDPDLFNAPWLPGNACEGGLTHSSARIKPYLAKLYWRAPAVGTGPVKFEFLLKQGDANTGAFFYPAKQLILSEGTSTAMKLVIQALPGSNCDAACQLNGGTCDPVAQATLATGAGLTPANGLTAFQTMVSPWYSCDHMFATCDVADPVRFPVTNDCTYLDASTCPQGTSVGSTCTALADPSTDRICACKPDPCNPSPCNAVGGSCSVDLTKTAGVLTEDSWACTCNSGFGGPTCNDLQATCGNGVDPNFPCLNGGGCVAPLGAPSVTCDCTSSTTGAYSGSTCEVPPPCNNDPCKTKDTGAVCRNVDLYGNRTFAASCSCSLGFSGPLCTVIDGCEIRNADPAQHCRNGGVCVDNSDDTNLAQTSSCNCPSGYISGIGSICDVDLDECAFGSNPCNGGVCINLPGTYMCNCTGTGLGGPTCSDDTTTTVITWCTPNNPCVYGTSCTECLASAISSPCTAADFNGADISAFHCNCQFGWTGQRCNIPVDFCTTNPCKNGGQCISDPISNPTTGYSCSCPKGYDPTDDCATNIDDCAALTTNPCANGGSCVDGVNSWSCGCVGDWKGATCLEAVTGAQTVTCRSDADCPTDIPCQGVGQFARCNIIGCINDASCPQGQVCTGSDIPGSSQQYCVQAVASPPGGACSVNSDCADESNVCEKGICGVAAGSIVTLSLLLLALF